jgi:ubiquinone/menaquinone biosynthesis C-methylase UbiE
MNTDVKEWLDERGMAFLSDIGIRKGHIVSDFGCGEGHYTIPAAKVVGKRGKVYAVDKDRDSLNELMRTAKGEGLKNIVPMYNPSEDLKIDLRDESVDVFLLYDLLHYMGTTERDKIYKESHRVLKADALLSVYPKHNKLDEPLWNLSDMRLEDVIEEIEGTQFHFEGKLYRKLIHDDNYNMGYILMFKKT